MSTVVTWSPSTDPLIASYKIESAPNATGSWSTVVTLSHSLTGTDYDAALGVFQYTDVSGSWSTWYRVTDVDSLGQDSLPSAPFQSVEDADPPLVSLDYVKLYLSITDSSTDALLQNLIYAASALFGSQTGRSFALRLYDEYQDGNDQRTLPLRHTPVQEVVSVSIDEAPVTPSVSVSSPGWFQDGSLVRLRGTTQTFNRGDFNVHVVYTAGPRSVPADVQQAVTELVALKFRERQNVGLGGASAVGASLTFLPSQIPMSVRLVIDAYRRVWF